MDPDTAALALVQSLDWGTVRLHALDAGRVRLDGGAMFGVVPKPLWERKIPADERNRIPLSLRCLLLETPTARILVETGIGNKEDAKFRDIYGVDNEPSPGTPYLDRLHEALSQLGLRAEDIDIVVNTHLHFDHAGGNTVRDAEGQVRVAFPRARYVVQRGEWDWAHRPNERTQASYLPANFDPVAAAGQLELVDGERELVPGVVLWPTPGHTPHHQSVLVRAGDRVACFVGDLIPTAAHLPLPWIMAYDLEPLRTLETKRAVLARAAAEGWLLVFPHDPVRAWGVLHVDGQTLLDTEAQR